MLRSMIVLAIAVSASAATAQNNRLKLIQDGFGNTATIDQSDAAGSSIGPLSDLTGGRLNLLPLRTRGALPVLNQVGDNNDIDIDIDGLGSQVLFSQNASLQGIDLANSGMISVQGNGVALLFQDGGGNDASIVISGAGAMGAITQIGSHNRSDLTVSGASAEGFLIQQGNNNIATGVQVGGTGARVRLMQTGDNLVSEGLVANSNAESVTIVQRNIRP
ncbi:hypothetical protein [Profundibacterium mesophilum]|nr:hypothetical protein [Profundibacterium mesophilum]